MSRTELYMDYLERIQENNSRVNSANDDTVSPVKTREGKAEIYMPHWNMYIVGICQWVKRRDGLLSGKKKKKTARKVEV